MDANGHHSKGTTVSSPPNLDGAATKINPDSPGEDELDDDLGFILGLGQSKSRDAAKTRQQGFLIALPLALIIGGITVGLVQTQGFLEANPAQPGNAHVVTTLTTPDVKAPLPRTYQALAITSAASGSISMQDPEPKRSGHMPPKERAASRAERVKSSSIKRSEYAARRDVQPAREQRPDVELASAETKPLGIEPDRGERDDAVESTSRTKRTEARLAAQDAIRSLRFH